MTEIRSALAQAMRDERLIMSRHEWDTLSDTAKEEWRRRADTVARLLRDHGYEIVKAGEPSSKAPYQGSPTILSIPTVTAGQDRELRLDGEGRWVIESRNRATGAVTVEQEFTLEQAAEFGTMVLAGDPLAATRRGLGRMLAATIEIYRLNATRMQP